MIKADVTALQKSLEEAKKLIQARLENMVAGFAADVAESASKATRIGDEGSLESNQHYRSLYEYRLNKFGIPVEVGYHKGAWTYAENGNLVFRPVINPAEEVKADTLTKAKAQYKLGDDFNIGAIGPAYETLQAKDDIEGTALGTLMQVYRTDLQRYYNDK